MTPRAAAEAAALDARYRAGGTDMQTWSPLPIKIIDLRDVEGLDGIEITRDGGVRIGAMVSIEQLSHSGPIRERAPALAAAAHAVATPQIRIAATVGGNLLQRTRCPYARHELVSCYRTGGNACPARHGIHDRHVVFDLGPCVAPHPSSLAVAFLAYGARVEVHDSRPLAVADLYGDGTDPANDHRLEPGRLLTGVVVPAPASDERAGYHRTTSRDQAEWPLVEAVARLRVSGGLVTDAVIAVGGVAPIPLRLPEVERRVSGHPLGAKAISNAASAAAAGANPLPGTRYKVPLLEATVRHLLEQLAGQPHVAGNSCS